MILIIDYVHVVPMKLFLTFLKAVLLVLVLALGVFVFYMEVM